MCLYVVYFLSYVSFELGANEPSGGTYGGGEGRIIFDN